MPDTAPPHSATAQVDADIRRLFVLAWVVVLLLVAGVGGWSVMATIGGAVVAPGKIVVEGKHRAIQHLDGGVVRALHIRDGDVVENDGLIATLDGTELTAELEGTRQELAAREAQAKTIGEELEKLIPLYAERLVTLSRITTLQREGAGVAADLARLKSQQSRLETRIRRLEIRAPAAGRVHNLVANTVGGVIAPNATIAEIVPTGESLVIEAHVAPNDVDQVRDGLEAEVRLTSFNQRTTPTISARLVRVSADLMREEGTGREYYLARVVLDERSLLKLGGRTLVPGMPAEVMIATGRRSALSYLTKPLADQISRAFREE